jgi:D-alanyl-D-alanine carboxypeptidase (penicillin-binding protein 5/6)
VLGAVLVAVLFAALWSPAASAATKKPPQLDARAWILVDARDGEPLAGRSVSRSLPIASATKLMTAYLALRDLDLDEMVSAPAYSAAPAESILGLSEGERISVRDLLVAMMLPSANDAASAVATEVAGSIPRFVVRMNGAARKLGLDDTSFANPIGLDDPLNVSSARDLATLTLVLRENEQFRKIVARPEATLRSGDGTRRVSSRNTLLGADESVDGVKTGHTRGAGYVLVASAERKGVPLVSVVLGASSEATRDAESERLLDYGFSLYEPRRAVRRSEELGDVAVSHEDDPLPLLAARGLEVTAREEQSIATTLRAPEQVEGPIEAGERVGRGLVTLDGERVGSVALVAGRDVAAPGPLDDLGGPLPVILVAGGSILVVIAFASAVRRGSSRRNAQVRGADQRVNADDRRRRRGEPGGEET